MAKKAHVLHRKHSVARHFNRTAQMEKLKRLEMLVQTGLIHDQPFKEIEMYMWDVPRDVWMPVYNGMPVKGGIVNGW